MPKLLRGSSPSMDKGGGAGGACVAADCTERARDPPLELLLESLLPKKQTEVISVSFLGFRIWLMLNFACRVKV